MGNGKPKSPSTKLLCNEMENGRRKYSVARATMIAESHENQTLLPRTGRTSRHVANTAAKPTIKNLHAPCSRYPGA